MWIWTVKCLLHVMNMMYRIMKMISVHTVTTVSGFILTVIFVRFSSNVLFMMLQVVLPVLLVQLVFWNSLHNAMLENDYLLVHYKCLVFS
jgi:hypothetical protein